MKYLFVILFLLSSIMFFSEDEIKIMDKILITSAFCDFRNDHFHTGIDISGKDQKIYSLTDCEMIFYNSTRKGSIRYGRGNFITLESNDHKFRYNYSHIKDYTINKNIFNYKKGDLIGISGNSGYSSGDHLHFEIELLEDTKLANPMKFIKVHDTLKPIIKDIIIVNDSERSSLLQYKNYNIKKRSKLFIQCFDKIDNSKYNITPYKISLFIDGEEKKTICFDILNKINENFYTDDNLKFEDIYVNMTNFDYFLGDLNIIPGVCGLKIIVEDYHGNKEEFKRPIKITL
ncbi:MAG: M23 family metallopeptidase [Spirochaetes bacterium]|nr:M23 family metallopeptidase [Spirochaetota bacterium]